MQSRGTDYKKKFEKYKKKYLLLKNHDHLLKKASVRLGMDNPEKVNNKMYKYIIQHPTYNADKISKKFKLGTSRPIFSFKRSGQSMIKLKDGRKVYIGGSQGKDGDYNFNIYNDVIVIDKNGKIDIYLYPPYASPFIENAELEEINGKLKISGGKKYLLTINEIEGRFYYQIDKGNEIFMLDLKNFKMSSKTVGKIEK